MHEAPMPPVLILNRPVAREQEFKVTITSKKTITPERLQSLLERFFDDVEVEDN